MGWCLRACSAARPQSGAWRWTEALTPTQQRLLAFVAWLCARQHTTPAGLQHSQHTAVNSLSVLLFLQVRRP